MKDESLYRPVARFPAHVNFKCTLDERAAMVLACHRLRMTLSAYLRHCVALEIKADEEWEGEG